jgi:hypothetical protein
MTERNTPHPEKKDYGGEDGWFISSTIGAMGVADGVGGWQDSGVNPADYSKTLMMYCKRYLEGEQLSVLLAEGPKRSQQQQQQQQQQRGVSPQSSPASPTTPDQQQDNPVLVLESGEWIDGVPPAIVAGDPIAPVEIQLLEINTEIPLTPQADSSSSTPMTSKPLNIFESEGGEEEIHQTEDPRTPKGALALAHKLTRLPGSSTACVLKLNKQLNTLDAVNLGDSGFVIIRNAKVVFRSPPLQHFFDCPFQLAAVPDFTSETDTVKDADVFRIPLKPGDCIIIATDGLLDNVFPNDIAALAPTTEAEVDAAADRLMALATKLASDGSYESPYVKAAQEAGFKPTLMESLMGMSFDKGKLSLGGMRGGKLDDITLLCALVVADE